MKDKLLWLIIVIVMIFLAASIIPESPFYYINWALFSAVIIILAMAAYFWRFEKSGANSKEVVLIATMASFAAISRIPFAAIGGLQPTTFIIMITGYVFGPQVGFVTGAAAALVSNFFLGQGPWTPWQMFSWGICGIAAGLLAGNGDKFKFIPFIGLSGVCGYFFGWIMNLWHWVGFVYPLNGETFIAVYIASIPFDTIHAAGNIAFSVLFGRSFYDVLIRFKKKLIVEYAKEENKVFQAKD